MIRRSLLVAGILLTTQVSFLQAQEWKPAGDKIKTSWGEQLKAERPHPEYPRPQLVRKDNWQNLNGLWNYAITEKAVASIPSQWDGKILVPFAVESALSGVGKEVGKDKALWYKNTISLAKNLQKSDLILHFGAVDWQCDVYVNGQHVGQHEGGFDPFSFDISGFVKKGDKQEIAIRVWDPTSDGPQPRGKQINNPHGIWYTPVTGIWQTVWVEAVPKTYIKATKQTPNVDKSTLAFEATVEGALAGDILQVTAFDGATKVSSQTAAVGSKIDLAIENPVLWSPTTPKLYDLKVEVLRKGKVVDQASSYFAMRKITMEKDAQGL